MPRFGYEIRSVSSSHITTWKLQPFSWETDTLVVSFTQITEIPAESSTACLIIMTKFLSTHRINFSLSFGTPLLSSPSSKDGRTIAQSSLFDVRQSSCVVSMMHISVDNHIWSVYYCYASNGCCHPDSVWMEMWCFFEHVVCVVDTMPVSPWKYISITKFEDNISE